MIVHPDPPLVKPDEAALNDRAPGDPRLDAFARLIEAANRTDAKATVAAIRELRALGWSVVAVAPARKGGDR